MKIIKIQFHPGGIVYNYLLDYKVKDPPTKGSYLKRIAGCSTYGAYYDFIYVVDVQEVKKLPKIVTSLATINGDRDIVEFYKLKEETIKKLQSIKIQQQPKIKVEKPRQHHFSQKAASVSLRKRLKLSKYAMLQAALQGSFRR